MVSKVIISLALILGSLCAVSSADENVATLAESICKSPKKVETGITSVQSMLALVDYFEHLPANNDLFKQCRATYYDSLVAMRELLTVGNDNACGDAKISAIEEFNRRFISTTRKDQKQQKKDHSKAPKLLKVFFAHYAYLISNKCKQSLLDQPADSAFEIVDENGKPADTKDLDQMLRNLEENFRMDLVNRRYDDLILPWKLLDNIRIPKKSKQLFRDPVIDAQHPVPVRVSIRVQDASKLQSLQQVCRASFKPSYSELILPVIRLATLGLYVDNDDQLAQRLVADTNLRRMFLTAQLCETALPIEAFTDASITRADKMVVLTVEKANELRASQPPGQVEQLPEFPVPASQSLVDLNDLPSLHDDAEAHSLYKELVRNRAKHEETSMRLLHAASSAIKGHSSSGDLTDAVDRDLASAELEIEGTESEPNMLDRKKRSLSRRIDTALFYFVVWLSVILHYAKKLIELVLKLVFVWPIKYTFKAVKWTTVTLPRKLYAIGHSEPQAKSAI